MANNVKKEFELYEPMRLWLQKYLEEDAEKLKWEILKTIEDKPDVIVAKN